MVSFAQLLIIVSTNRQAMSIQASRFLHYIILLLLTVP
jgi:hypothetical protein